VVKHLIILSLLCKMTLGFPTNLAGQNWTQWESGNSSFEIQSLFVDDVSGVLYMGGVGNGVYRVSEWTGSEWNELGSDLPGQVFKMVRFENELCISSGLYVMRWNGSEWDIIAESTNPITDIEVYAGELYASTYNGVLEKWNGLIWQPANPTWYFSTPKGLKMYDNELYVAGSFISEFGSNIIRWNGLEWLGLDSGIEELYLPEFGSVMVEFAVYNDELYVSSNFREYDENPDNYIARWDGTNWHPVGGGLDYVSSGMVEFNDGLYVVGGFEHAGGVMVPGIAKWDGTQWCNLGSTFNGGFSAIAVYNNQLIIGGSFTAIDGNAINRIAKWVGEDYVAECGTLSSIKDVVEPNTAELTIHPNPTTATTTLTWQSQTHGNYQLLMYDVHGRAVVQQSGTATTGKNTQTIDMGAFAKGIYFGRLLVGEEVRGFKVVRE